MDISVGDKVQLINGAVDISTGRTITSGQSYSVGSSSWATVSLILTDYKTGSIYGSDPIITKVQLTDGDMVVWQGDINDISSNVIHASDQSLVQTSVSETSYELPQTESGKALLTNPNNSVENTQSVNYKGENSTSDYVPTGPNKSWVSGGVPSAEKAVDAIDLAIKNSIHAKEITGSSMNIPPNSQDVQVTSLTATDSLINPTLLRARQKIISQPFPDIDPSDPIYSKKFATIKSDPNKLRELLSNDIENIQNTENFPKQVSAGSTSNMLAAKYDYQIIPGTNSYSSSSTLENRLRDARKEFGIQIHGSNSIARLVKYYMYNRFKVPDTNLAFNRSTTHVFFTRPDLNLLNCTGGKANGANSQTLNHSESSMVYKRYPEIFKLLTDRRRCGDDNNFNLLLSNQVESFDIGDETLTTVDSGKSWNDYTISYGDSYSGKSAGEFSCTFRETSDMSVINLLKLWITYIDNVGRGAWSPSYNLNGTGVSKDINMSHVYRKTLDYAASVYVFKCGPDGEDVLYWSKYYGVFPTNTGASALSWNLGDSICDTPKLNIKFKYSFKRDMSPISLMEFNDIANVGKSASWVPAYSSSTNECARPFVGKPYIQLKLKSPQLIPGSLNYSRGLTQIRLKFTDVNTSGPNDDQLYKYSLSK